MHLVHNSCSASFRASSTKYWLVFQVEGFYVEPHFKVNRISRDVGSFPWANAERGKPRLAENLVVIAAVSEAHTQIHKICMKTDNAPSLVRRGFCTMPVFILTLFNENNTFECDGTHDIYSYVKYCKQGLAFCSHKKLNLNMLILTPQIIPTPECCRISMQKQQAGFIRGNLPAWAHILSSDVQKLLTKVLWKMNYHFIGGICLWICLKWVWNMVLNKCLLYTNKCTSKWCKFVLKLLRQVSVLIHHPQGVWNLC